MRPSRRLRAGLTAAAAATALAGCSGSGGTTAAPTTGGSAGDTITIKNFKYSPSPLLVKSGQKITVTNSDSTTHTITADDKSFDSKKLAGGKSFTFTAGKAGTYTYICSIHNYMTGTITVS